MADSIAAVGAAAYHFGNAVDMEAVMKAAPEDVLCMGNRLTVKGKLKCSCCNIKDYHHCKETANDRHKIKVLH